jgi:hypothetical protein
VVQNDVNEEENISEESDVTPDSEDHSNDDDNNNNNNNDDDDNSDSGNNGRNKNGKPNGPFLDSAGIYVPIGGKSINLCDPIVINSLSIINEKVKNKLIKVCGFNSAGYLVNKIAGSSNIGKTLFGLWDLFGSSRKYKDNQQLAKILNK